MGDSVVQSRPYPPDNPDVWPLRARRQSIARFLALYEIFNLQRNVKGSIVECGVHHGASLMTWAKLSATLEPYGYQRKVVGFDTFAGFPRSSIGRIDGTGTPETGRIMAGSFACNMARLNESIEAFDEDRPISHKQKVELVQGDVMETIPKWLETNKHAMISLLFLDLDLYKPTLFALESFEERLVAGSVIAFDEINNPDWPGEAEAFREAGILGALRCFEWEPNVSYMVIE